MIVSDAVRMITFKAATINDIAGLSINKLFTNQSIIDELNLEIAEYARVTKGITDVYSFPLQKNTPFVPAPPYALRSESYFYLGYISGGTIFGMDMRGLPEVYNTFRYSPMQGISNWLMPWGAGNSQFLSVFPMTGTPPQTTTLTAGINASVTTIPITSSVGFVHNSGRITIDTEVILYSYYDGTNFYGCVRGSEMTTAATHLSNATVTQNNVFLHYARLPVPFANLTNDSITPIASNVLDPCFEHMQGIIKLIAYNLIMKIDSTRAAPYKVDAEEMYLEYKLEIRRGYYAGRGGTDVRPPFPTNESGHPYGANIIY